MPISTKRKPHDDQILSGTAGRILSVAEALFSEHGFDAVSINAIAERAGVSKANVFHHFTTKDALYLAVLKDCGRQQAELLEDFIQGDEPVAERLGTFARAHLATMLERKQMSRLMQREMVRGGSRRGQELAQKVFGENFARFVEIIQRGQSQGELRKEVDPTIIALMIVGADVFFFQTQHVLRHLPGVSFGDKPEEYSAKVVDLLLQGILNQSGAGN